MEDEEIIDLIIYGDVESARKLLEQLLRERDEARESLKVANKAVETLINHVNKVYMEMFK